MRVLSTITMIIAALAMAISAAGMLTSAAGAATDCSTDRAWPDGPHLSEKNEGIVDLFFATWGNRACAQWADEHRVSAIRGLRKLGYRVQMEPQTLPGTPTGLPGTSATYSGGATEHLVAEFQGHHDFAVGQKWSLRHRVTGTAPPPASPSNGGKSRVTLVGPGGEADTFHIWTSPGAGDTWDLTDFLIIQEGALYHDYENHYLPPGRWAVYVYADIHTQWEVFLERAE